MFIHRYSYFLFNYYSTTSTYILEYQLLKQQIFVLYKNSFEYRGVNYVYIFMFLKIYKHKMQSDINSHLLILMSKLLWYLQTHI